MKQSFRALVPFAAGMATVVLAAPVFAQAPLAPVPTAQLPAASSGVVGFWEGKLNVTASLSLTLGFQVQEKEGKLSSTLDVPEQGAKGLPVGKTTLTGGKTITFELPNLGATFTGKLSEDGKSIVGTFTQNGHSLPLTLERKQGATAPNRPQEPKAPFPYKTVEVAYDNPAAPGVRLAGTLTLPEGKGPFPVALMITGSGPQDRDETVMGHKPFLVLADYLARRGIATLRVDDRGVGKSTVGDLANAVKVTSADFASDARAGVDFLKTRPEVDAKNIGLIGHSEGGMIAPMVAAEAPGDVAFVVLLAGTGVPGDQILLEQGKLIARAMGQSEEKIQRTLAISARLYAANTTEEDPVKRRAKFETLAQEEVAKLPEAERKEAGEALKQSLDTLSLPWFHYFLTYDPVPTLRKVRCPVLAINGEKDLQVAPKQNLPPIEAALKAGGNQQVTVREMPGLNHLFQTAKTGSVAEYAAIEETFSPDALKVVGDWIVERTK